MPEENVMPAIIPRIFYTIIFMMGVGLYIGWGILFNVWFDIGVYALCVVMIGFGLVGMLLYSYFERQELEQQD
jgi:membrane protease YdiL (CAAX protease family)